MDGLSLLVLLGCVVMVLVVGSAVLLVLMKRGSSARTVVSTQARYRRAPFLTAAESAFAQSLRHAAGSSWHLMAKVRLADLVDVSDPADRAGLNKVSSKHVDFVLCDPQSLQPALIVELDDRSHERVKRRERDAFVDAALESVGLRVTRFKVAWAYDPEVLRHRLVGASQPNAEAESMVRFVEAKPTGPEIPTTDELRKRIRRKLAELARD